MNDKDICDCGHSDQVHSDSDPKFCESCGGKCRVGGFQTWQRQIDALEYKIDTLERRFLEKQAEGVRDASVAQIGTELPFSKFMKGLRD